MPDTNLQPSSQDEINLFLLNELERLTLLMDSLKRKGLVSEDDLALAQLQQEVKGLERRQRVAVQRGDTHGAREAQQAIRDLESRIGILEQKIASRE